MKRTYIYVNGELVEKGSKEHYDSLGPTVMPDIAPYKSMIDGSMITSRSVHRDHLRQHGCIEVGNERMETKLPPPKDTRREVMQAQLANMTHKQAKQIINNIRRKFT
tara:strand:- start:753 stop:1073 length:321 start_codon:yes stop_codon:yes gene_type:complete